MAAKTKLIPAVAYIRMSSDAQEKSPAQQRAEIIKLASRYGYHILRWYTDEGISGDATDKRLQFQKMIADARERQDHEVILCWDQSRFGRFDSLEAGYWIYPLIQAGVTKLVTVADGVIDWQDDGARAMFGLRQDFSNKKFLIDLSRNATRGAIDAAKRGHYRTVPPYGYDRCLYNESGELMKRVPYGEMFAAPRGWHCQLSPSDGGGAETVRWIFDQFANTPATLNGIASDLNLRGIPSPKGSTWHRGVIRQIITNPVYVGTIVYGQRKQGRYHQIGDGGNIVKAGTQEAGLIVTHDAHEPLVSQELFDAAQGKTKRRKGTGTPKPASPFPLTGVLVCGHCGCRLVGRKEASRRYVCSGGKRGPGVCRSRSVLADSIESVVIDRLQTVALADANLERIRQKLACEIEAQAKSTKEPATAASLKRKLKELDAKVKRGAESLLLIDPSHLADASAALDDWKRQRADVQGQIDLLALIANKPQLDATAAVEKAIDKLRQIRKQITSAAAPALREIYLSMFEGIRIWWDDYTTTTGAHRARFREGVLTLRTGGTDSFLLSSDPTIRCGRSLTSSSRPTSPVPTGGLIFSKESGISRCTTSRPTCRASRFGTS